MSVNLAALGVFGAVLDVGGNIGDFAAAAVAAWPGATVVSFEPAAPLAEANRRRANGRWRVEEVACSDRDGEAWLNFCANQHSASSLEEHGTVRRDLFGIHDRYLPMRVQARPLDSHLGLLGAPARRPLALLVKIDVEGHERQVIAGGRETLSRAEVVVCEVQQDPQVFPAAASARELDGMLRSCGLRFAGVWDVLKAPDGRVVQFDGIWRR